MTGYTPDQAAHIIHETIRAMQTALGDPNPAPPWDDADDDQRASTRTAIAMALDGATEDDLHRSWTMTKIAAGYTPGPTRDPIARTHPNLGLARAQLPPTEQAKDTVLLALVRILLL